MNNTIATKFQKQVIKQAKQAIKEYEMIIEESETALKNIKDSLNYLTKESEKIKINNFT